MCMTLGICDPSPDRCWVLMAHAWGALGVYGPSRHWTYGASGSSGPAGCADTWQDCTNLCRVGADPAPLYTRAELGQLESKCCSAGLSMSQSLESLLVLEPGRSLTARTAWPRAGPTSGMAGACPMPNTTVPGPGQPLGSMGKVAEAALPKATLLAPSGFPGLSPGSQVLGLKPRRQLLPARCCEGPSGRESL